MIGSALEISRTRTCGQTNRSRFCDKIFYSKLEAAFALSIAIVFLSYLIEIKNSTQKFFATVLLHVNLQNHVLFPNFAEIDHV